MNNQNQRTKLKRNFKLYSHNIFNVWIEEEVDLCQWAPKPGPCWAGSTSKVAYTIWSNHKNCWSLQSVFIHGCINTLLPWDMPSETLTWMQTFLSFLWGTLFSFKTHQEMGSRSLLYNSLMAWTLVQETGKVGSFPCSVRGDPSLFLHLSGHVLCLSYRLLCARQHSPAFLLKLSQLLLIKKLGVRKKTACSLLASNLPVSRH